MITQDDQDKNTGIVFVGFVINLLGLQSSYLIYNCAVYSNVCNWHYILKLYHEATVANLLETVMYHRETAEAADDSVLDLLDYCYRKITFLVSE